MAMVVMSALMAAMLGGCAGSYQARSVDVKGATLVNPDILQEGKDDQVLYRYVNPKADVKQYTRIMIDPVLVKKDGELDKEELQNYQNLANNAYVYLGKELEQDYMVVKAPEPGTMRIQMAIIDADSSKPVRNTLSTFVPIGMAVSLIKYSATGKQSGVGEITVEMRITDAATGELLGAALDRRVGGKDIGTLWSSWANADDSLKFWAQKLRYALCDMRGGGVRCVKPGEKK
jgi:PBP1b-binding outer membrane lipoprotein LpoB